jgi:hypothetical protein
MSSRITPGLLLWIRGRFPGRRKLIRIAKFLLHDNENFVDIKPHTIVSIVAVDYFFGNSEYCAILSQDGTYLFVKINHLRSHSKVLS